jgi:hypothetical protein
MRCFVHHDHEAVGICRACNKGLCPDCAVDLGHSISCRGACEQKAQKMHAEFVRGIAMMNRSEAILNAQKRGRFILLAFCILLGAVYIGFNFSARDPFNFGTVSGAIFLIFGLALFVRQHRMYKTIDRNQS